MVRFALILVALGCTARRPERQHADSMAEAEDTKADKSLLEGIVADALREMKVQKELQLDQQQQSLANTNRDLEHLRSELHEKENCKKWYECAWKWVRRTFGKKLNQEINNLKLVLIPKTEGLRARQMKTIATLKAAIEQFSTASSSAESLETSVDKQKDLIKDLTVQLETLNGIREKMVTDHQEQVEVQKKKNEAMLRSKQAGIDSITTLLNKDLSEHALLTETHNQESCAEKRKNQERICETCSDGQVPCGDRCIADGQSCYHDIGCACSESSPALLQVESTRPQETHADVKRIADAKAAIRKAIEEHGDSIKNYADVIATAKQEKLSVEREKAVAVEEYDTAIKGFQDSIEQNTEAKTSEETAKEESEAELEKVTSEGKAELQKLAALLHANIQKLKTSRRHAEATYATQLKTNQESMEALLDSHAENLNQRDMEVDSLQKQKQSAETLLADFEKQLANLKAEHLN